MSLDCGLFILRMMQVAQRKRMGKTIPYPWMCRDRKLEAVRDQKFQNEKKMGVLHLDV